MTKWNRDSPKLSVITVVYNGVQFLEPTIQSVINQTFIYIEYIIIDGGSRDGTVEIVEKYSTKISYWVSEKDKGIYDAMNKGMALAKGEYILFLNAGDRLSNKDTINQIFKDSSSSDVYYGRVDLIHSDGAIQGERRLKPPENLSWQSFRWGMMVSHQAFIAKKSLAEKFDTHYKISADFDWCIKIMKKAKKLHNTHLVISFYLIGGASRQNTILSWKERFQIMVVHYGLLTTVWTHFLIIIRFLWFFLQSGRLD